MAPSYVIEPEIKKIHPDLRPETLTLYQKITTNDITITAGGSVAKDRIQNSFHAIRRGLEGILSVAFFISLFGIGGCGVKTLPKSTMEAIRPSIPFRVLPPKQSTLAPKKEIKKP